MFGNKIIYLSIINIKSYMYKKGQKNTIYLFLSYL